MPSTTVISSGLAGDWSTSSTPSTARASSSSIAAWSIESSLLFHRALDGLNEVGPATF
jgi:hypothetical protein